MVSPLRQAKLLCTHPGLSCKVLHAAVSLKPDKMYRLLGALGGIFLSLRIAPAEYTGKTGG